MSYWSMKPGAAGNIRLYVRGDGWRSHDDVKNDKGEVVERGSARAIEDLLTSALNASNLILLTGAGSSFCARNATISLKTVEPQSRCVQTRPALQCSC